MAAATSTTTTAPTSSSSAREQRGQRTFWPPTRRSRSRPRRRLRFGQKLRNAGARRSQRRRPTRRGGGRPAPPTASGCCSAAATAASCTPRQIDGAGQPRPGRRGDRQLRRLRQSTTSRSRRPPAARSSSCSTTTPNPPVFRRGGELDVGEEPQRRSAPSISTATASSTSSRSTSAARRSRRWPCRCGGASSQGFPEFDAAAALHRRREAGARLVDRPTSTTTASMDVAMLNRARGARRQQRGRRAAQPRRRRAAARPVASACPARSSPAARPCRSLALPPGDFDGNGNDRPRRHAHRSAPRRAARPARRPTPCRSSAAAATARSFRAGCSPPRSSPLSIAAGDLTGDGLAGHRRRQPAHPRPAGVRQHVVAGRTGDRRAVPARRGMSLRPLHQRRLLRRAVRSGAERSVQHPRPRGHLRSGRPAIECEMLRVRGPGSPECDPARSASTASAATRSASAAAATSTDSSASAFPAFRTARTAAATTKSARRGNCSDNFVCCREACDGGFCEPGTGVCRDSAGHRPAVQRGRGVQVERLRRVRRASAATASAIRTTRSASPTKASAGR